MVYYSEYHILLLVYYGEYHNLLWFTTVNTTFYYGLLQWIPHFAMVYYGDYHNLLLFSILDKLLCSQLILTTICP